MGVETTVTCDACGDYGFDGVYCKSCYYRMEEKADEADDLRKQLKTAEEDRDHYERRCADLEEALRLAGVAEPDLQKLEAAGATSLTLKR